jgi:lactate dehydrogenase-like 2-hydroxyacid dehydrogenase
MSDKPLLLQLGNFTQRMEDSLSPHFAIHKLMQAPDRAALLAEVGGSVTAACTDGHWGIPDDVFDACPNLKAVSSYGVGYDAIDTDRAVERGILVGHTPSVLNQEVATTAILMWLAVRRNLIPDEAWARSGQWEKDGNAPLSRSVQGTTVGILGLGRIGLEIARLVEAFGAKVAYSTRSKKEVGYPYYASALELAQAVDTMIVITPGGAETRHLVNKAVLDALGPEGTLLNISRGSVVDEDALVAALADGRLGSAALDVFEAEPKIPDALKTMSNVVLTPHVGSATVETRDAMGDLVCDNLIEWLKSGKMKTPVPECKHL